MITALVPKPYRTATHYVTVPNCDNGTLPVTVIGLGQPVLLLHAYGMDTREFLPFLLPLTTKYQFYLPHFRGFGLAKSIPLTQFDFLGQYAEDINAVIEQICSWRDRDSIAVAAISMGAQVMWAYFERYGIEKVSRYLNIDQNLAIHNQADWQGGLFGEQQATLFAQFESLITKSAPYLHIHDFRHLPYTIKSELLDMERSFSLLSVGRTHSQLLAKTLSYRAPHKIALMNHATWQHKLRCLDAYMQLPYDYRNALAQVNIPITLLIGARSQLYDPKWQQRLIDMLPDATAQILPKSGHAVPLDAPVSFYKVLKGFLENK